VSRTWRITAADSERDQRTAAASLRANGLREGDRVVLALATSPRLLATILGGLRSGIVPVLLHPGLLPAERRRLVDDAEPALVIDDEPGLEKLFDAAAPAATAVELADVPRARAMHYTSGTSGRPKGVWSGVLSDDDARALFDDEADIWQFTADDTLLICSQLHHSVTVRYSTTVLLRGGTVLLTDRFDAEAVSATIAAERPTAMFMVPAHLQRLFAQAPAQMPDLSSIRTLVHAGAPCPDTLKRRAIDAFPDGAVWEFYGSTEGQFTVCSPDDWLHHPGTVGRARPNRAVVTDDDGQIWCRVPPFARFEYWRDAVKTAAAWRAEDHAFTVGDLGRVDGDGFLYLDGRRDDLIITGGVNVYPAEVEQVIAAVPGVTEVAVFGAPDERWGQRVCAAVVGEADPDAVIAHARGALAPFKCPKDVYLVDDLPRTVTGKVRRSAVADQLGLG
jgi:acyl-CoA synthetase (AMP-forming)/AMP-acid ligase II